MWTEARTDAKLRLLTDAEHRVWFQLLCYAAEQKERGVVNGVPRGKLAAEVARGSETLLERTIDKLERLHVVTRDRNPDRLTFLHFGERQYEYPSERPVEVARRKAKHKERAGTSVERAGTTKNEPR